MRWKNALEVLSAVLMGLAAIVLLYKLLVPQVQTRWTTADVSIPASDLRNIQGSGDRVVLMFSDYECPACASFHRGSYPTLESKIIKPSMARFAVVNLPLEKIHPGARGAAEAAECAAAQGHYWLLFDRLFQASPDLSTYRIDSEAEGVRLDMDAFHRCRAAGQSAALDNDVRLAKQFGVSSTPSFFVGRLVGDRFVFHRSHDGAPTVDSLVRELDGHSALGRWWNSMF
jgi:protein-disulfide isomerase